MAFLNITLIVGLLLCLMLTIFQFVKKNAWWVRFADFPHIQITVLTVFFAGAIAYFIGMDPWYILALEGLSLLAIGYQLYIIFPYTPLAKKQSKDAFDMEDDQMVSILESNVLMENRGFSKLLHLVKEYDPDILITLETDKKWEDALIPIEAIYKYSIKNARDNTYGMHLYSKLIIKDFKIENLIEDDVPSFEVDIEMRNGSVIKMYVVHPKPPSPTENDSSIERDAEMIVVGKRAKKCKMPVIVAGDLNDVAWSHTTRLFQRISELLDPRIGRGLFNTFNAKYALIRWPLDHVFQSKDFLVNRIKRLPTIGSDHFPMYIQLSLARAEGHAKNGSPEKVDAEYQNETKEKVAQARE